MLVMYNPNKHLSVFSEGKLFHQDSKDIVIPNGIIHVDGWTPVIDIKLYEVAKNNPQHFTVMIE